jgi:hypothetical protein
LVLPRTDESVSPRARLRKAHYIRIKRAIQETRSLRSLLGRAAKTCAMIYAPNFPGLSQKKKKTENRKYMPKKLVFAQWHQTEAKQPQMVPQASPDRPRTKRREMCSIKPISPFFLWLAEYVRLSCSFGSVKPATKKTTRGIPGDIPLEFMEI